jgi:hypothetical protein
VRLFELLPFRLGAPGVLGANSFQRLETQPIGFSKHWKKTRQRLGKNTADFSRPRKIFRPFFQALEKPAAALQVGWSGGVVSDPATK